MSVPRVFRLGRLVVSLDGERVPLLGHVADELQPIAAPGAGPPAVRFTVRRQAPPLRSYVVAKPVCVEGARMRVDLGGLFYDIRNEDGVTDVVVYAPPLRRRLRARVAPDALRRLRDWNYLDAEEVRAKDFMYNLFDYVTQMRQLSLGQSYVHASSFTRGERCVAVCAWGGIGKTTTLLKMVAEHGWRFLSDDLGLIDDEGIVWRTPKKLQVYAYNVEGQPRLRTMLLQGRSSGDLLSWNLHLRRSGPSGVRRRVSAEDLFGKDRVAERARLTDLFYLERADVPDFEHAPLTSNELCARAAATVLREVEPFGLLSAAVRACGSTEVLPSVSELLKATEATLARAFAGVTPRRVLVPMRAGPDDLVRHLMTLL